VVVFAARALFLLCSSGNTDLSSASGQGVGLGGDSGTYLLSGQFLLQLGASRACRTQLNGRRCPLQYSRLGQSPKAHTQLLFAVLPGFGLLLPSCFRGGKRGVLGQADPA